MQNCGKSLPVQPQKPIAFNQVTVYSQPPRQPIEGIPMKAPVKSIGKDDYQDVNINDYPDDVTYQQQQQQQIPQQYISNMRENQQQGAVVHFSQSQQQQINGIDKKAYPASANGMRDPMKIQCPICSSVGITRVENNTCNLTTALWFVVTGCFCCFIPGCCKNQTEVYHYCTQCNSKVGKKDAKCL